MYISCKLCDTAFELRDVNRKDQLCLLCWRKKALSQLREQYEIKIVPLIARMLHGTEEDKAKALEEMRNSPLIISTPYGSLTLDLVGVNNEMKTPIRLVGINGHPLKDIKLWLINDSSWYASLTKEDALAKYCQDQELDTEESARVEVTEVPDEELDILMFPADESCDGEGDETFREHLHYLFLSGAEFPCEFAFEE